MNRNWDIMRNAANGADPFGGTSRMDQTRMRDREHFTSRDREEAEYGYGGYGHEPLVGRHGAVGSYGDEGFGRPSQGWGDYGGYEGGRHERERGALGRMEEGIDRAFGNDWERHERRPTARLREREMHPTLWQRVKGAFTGKGPKNWARSDERIREDVCEALTYDAHVDASDIEVSVKDGEVTLIGTVSGRGEKRLAEDVAEGVRGVSDVHNQLRIRR